MKSFVFIYFVCRYNKEIVMFMIAFDFNLNMGFLRILANPPLQNYLS